MAQLTINIPDPILPDVLDAFALRFGYQNQIANPNFDPELPESETNPRTIDNPEGKAQFAKRMLIGQIKHVYNIARLRQLKENIKSDLDELN